uniref:Uncharacterized protein n=1 Tax=Bactrocera dorsalis TaxID=27457 RepID=A0A034V2Z1_BACDO
MSTKFTLNSNKQRGSPFSRKQQQQTVAVFVATHVFPYHRLRFSRSKVLYDSALFSNLIIGFKFRSSCLCDRVRLEQPEKLVDIHCIPGSFMHRLASQPTSHQLPFVSSSRGNSAISFIARLYSCAFN